MQNIIDINKDVQAEPIILYLESMLNETSEKIEKKVTEFNQMIDYCIQYGQQYMYVTAERNGEISYDGLMLLEAVSNQAKKEIKLRNAETNVEKARVIENIVSYVLKDVVYFGDDDFLTSCSNNLIEALKVRRGSCCHFAALTHYLHLRNNMYSDLIRSRVNVESTFHGEIYHIFNLLFLDNPSRNCTFVDTMWEKQFLRLRDKNRFSFVSLNDIQSEPNDEYGAHIDIVQDLSNISSISFDMENIDKKLGYNNKFSLYGFIQDLVWYIKYANIDDIKYIFEPEASNILNENILKKIIGLVSYASALELGHTGLDDTSKRPDETNRIYCLDTYLKEILPTIYITFFRGRIIQTNPSVLNDYNSQIRYLSSLFEVIKTKDGSVGIHFDDTIDKAYLNIGFGSENNIPFVEVLNSIQFEKKCGTIKDTKSTLDHEIVD